MGLGKFATIDAGVWKVVAVVAGVWKVVAVVAGLWKVVTVVAGLWKVVAVVAGLYRIVAVVIVFREPAAPAGQRDRPRPGGPMALGGGAEGDGVAGEHDSTV